MRNLFVFILVGFLFLNCSGDDDNNTDQINGEWKLITAEYYGINANDEYELYSIDYTEHNIIYHFKNDGTLVVSGGENMGYNNGQYQYFFGEDHLNGGTDPKVLLVKIENAKWTYNLSQGQMRLGQTYLDGVDLIFKRK